jgi:hypothetical protein
MGSITIFEAIARGDVNDGDYVTDSVEFANREDWLASRAEFEELYALIKDGFSTRMDDLPDEMQEFISNTFMLRGTYDDDYAHTVDYVLYREIVVVDAAKFT